MHPFDSLCDNFADLLKAKLMSDASLSLKAVSEIFLGVKFFYGGFTKKILKYIELFCMHFCYVFTIRNKVSRVVRTPHAPPYM